MQGKTLIPCNERNYSSSFIVYMQSNLSVAFKLADKTHAYVFAKGRGCIQLDNSIIWKKSIFIILLRYCITACWCLSISMKKVTIQCFKLQLHHCFLKFDDSIFIIILNSWCWTFRMKRMIFSITISKSFFPLVLLPSYLLFILFWLLFLGARIGENGTGYERIWTKRSLFAS